MKGYIESFHSQCSSKMTQKPIRLKESIFLSVTVVVHTLAFKSTEKFEKLDIMSPPFQIAALYRINTSSYGIAIMRETKKSKYSQM